jgi:hypothetical protein
MIPRLGFFLRRNRCRTNLQVGAAMATDFADASGEVLRLQRGGSGASAGQLWEVRAHPGLEGLE